MAQALERLNAAALESIDQTMQLLLLRTRKRTDVILPHVLHFVADMMRPLLEKIDTVQYSQRSRMLKVAEEYAKRLLQPGYPAPVAGEIARKLVENYPEHGFVIDADEARELGLRITNPTDEQSQILDGMLRDITTINAVGRITETP